VTELHQFCAPYQLLPEVYTGYTTEIHIAVESTIGAVTKACIEQSVPLN